MKYLLPFLAVAAIAGIPCPAFAWSPGVASPMPSKGFTVDTSDRNDVISFYQAVFKASEGFDKRPMWKEHATQDFYKVDFSKVYTYGGLQSTSPLTKDAPNGTRSAGELHLNFVKDVERRVNFYRALAGVPAIASLMDSDAAKNTSTIEPTGLVTNYDPPLTATKADAAQQSAYLISRTFIDKWVAGSWDWAMRHEQTTGVIPGLSAWSKEAWNAHRHSNITRGYYGPMAIDKYMWEDEVGVGNDGKPKENLEVGHRRKILAITSTNFATGDMPPEYVPSRLQLSPALPALRPAANALYHIQRPSEKSSAAPRFVSYPNSGFFPAPLNSPFWSLTHPNANFAGAIVTMTDGSGGSINTSDLTISTQPESSLSWRVNSTSATATSLIEDRTYHVTVSAFTVSGIPSSHSFSVTLINPDLITSPQSLTGASAPPAAGSAAYILTPPPGVESLQVNTFINSTATWAENAETATPTKVIGRTYGNYAFNCPMNEFTPGTPTSIPAIQGTRSFRLTHAVRYDAVADGVPDEIIELGREILPSPTATSTLQFSYRRGLMTTSSTLAVEISSNQGLSWLGLGSTISGHIAGSTGSPEGSVQAWSSPLPPSTIPYLVRFRFYKSGTGSTYNHSEPATANAATGIFLDDIKTSANATWLDLKKTNEVAASTSKFVLDNTTAGMTLSTTQALLLRTRAKLGGNWMQYGPSKVVTPTSSPTPGFAGWTAYEYPELTGGFAGDHDGDGVPNAVEFAFYQNPLQPSTSSDTIVLSISSGLGKAVDTIAIERSIPSQRPGFDYGAEWSDTLAPGSWSSIGVNVTFPSGKVVATAPAGPARRFIRWKFVE